MSETKRVIDLTVRMAQRSISSEFKGTALGRLWSFINPLATIAVYALIFGVVFRGEADKGVNSGLSSFALWIGVGVIAWNFMSSGIQRGMDSLVGNLRPADEGLTSRARSSSTPPFSLWPTISLSSWASSSSSCASRVVPACC